VVEIQLKHLDQVQQAFDLVRTSGSSQGAQFVAEYCQSQNDYRGAIEFLLIANKSEDAFKLAQAQSMMDVYTSMIGEGIFPEDAMKVAQYYEKSQDYGRAGRYTNFPSFLFSRHSYIYVICFPFVVVCSDSTQFVLSMHVR
jgi:WD repeat-containing protein 19